MTPAELRDLYERRQRALTRRPGFGRTSESARVRLGPADACEVDEEATRRRLRVDLAVEEGGAGADPRPGELMRAAVGACLALGCRTWAARLGVSLQAVELELQCDYDARGQLALAGDDVPVGWQRLVIQARLIGDAPEAELRRVAEAAIRRSPMLANLSPTVELVHRLTIARPAHAAAGPASPATAERPVPSQVTPPE